MVTSRDVALARMSDAAYSDAPVVLPADFRPVSSAELEFAPASGETFSNGLYRNQNAAALVVSGSLDGVRTLVVAFRGSDDREDSVNSLTNPNADYADFTHLIGSLDAQVAGDGYRQVVVTGHSLGGALAQVFMADHPDSGGPVRYRADTFGSPGALISDGPDARVTNFVVADDPAVFLGEHRAETGAILRADPLLAGSTALLAAVVFPGLTPQDALDALRAPLTDYENRGETVLFPGADGSTDPVSSFGELARASPDEHRVELYVAAVSSAAQVVRLYDAALDRAPDQGGADYYTDQLLRGRSLVAVAQNFIDSPEFHTTFGADLSNAGYVTLLYEKALNRGAGADELAYYVGGLEGGTVGRAQVAVNFSESPEHIGLIDLTAAGRIADQHGIAFA